MAGAVIGLWVIIGAPVSYFIGSELKNPLVGWLTWVGGGAAIAGLAVFT